MKLNKNEKVLQKNNQRNVKNPNKETIDAINEVKEGRCFGSFDSVEELIKELEK